MEVCKACQDCPHWWTFSKDNPCKGCPHNK